MPTPRHVKNYPIELIKLFERAGRQRVVIEYKSEEEALAQRNYLYTVRRALLNQPEFYPIPSLLAGLVRFTIEGHLLIAEPATDANEEIKKALEDAPSSNSNPKLPT